MGSYFNKDVEFKKKEEEAEEVDDKPKTQWYDIKNTDKKKRNHKTQVVKVITSYINTNKMDT